MKYFINPIFIIMKMFENDQNKSFPSFALKASSSLQFLEAEMYKS